MAPKRVARIGIEKLVSITPDRVELRDLDGPLNTEPRDVAAYKAGLESRHWLFSGVAERFKVQTAKNPIQSEGSYTNALDCDLIFSALDKPFPKDLLNCMSYAHYIPVITGDMSADTKADGTLRLAT